MPEHEFVQRERKVREAAFDEAEPITVNGQVLLQRGRQQRELAAAWQFVERSNRTGAVTGFESLQPAARGRCEQGAVDAELRRDDRQRAGVFPFPVALFETRCRGRLRGAETRKVFCRVRAPLRMCELVVSEHGVVTNRRRCVTDVDDATFLDQFRRRDKSTENVQRPAGHVEQSALGNINPVRGLQDDFPANGGTFGDGTSNVRHGGVDVHDRRQWLAQIEAHDFAEQRTVALRRGVREFVATHFLLGKIARHRHLDVVQAGDVDAGTAVDGNRTVDGRLKVGKRLCSHRYLAGRNVDLRPSGQRNVLRVDRDL